MSTEPRVSAFYSFLSAVDRNIISPAASLKSKRQGKVLAKAAGDLENIATRYIRTTYLKEGEQAVPVKKSAVYGMLFISVLAFVFLLRKQPFSNRADPQPVWFEDVKSPISISASDQKALVDYVTSAILRGERSNERHLPAALADDDLPRIVFLSVSDTKTPARVLMGSGAGIVKAVDQAIEAAKRISDGDYQPQWIKLDVVQNVRYLFHSNFNKPLEIIRSIEGIASEGKFGIAFLPDELVARTLVNKKHELQPKNIKKYLARRSISSKQFATFLRSRQEKMYVFRTDSFFSDGQEVVSLYRGHRSFDDISPNDYLAAARAGGRYLVRATRADGKFDYAYLPKTDVVSKKYNILRHAGTIYAMCELYEITGEAELLTGAQRAIGYLLQSILPCPYGGETLSCVVEENEIKLGGNALAAVALAKYINLSGETQHIAVLRKLGRWIQSVQDEDGRFRVHKQTYPEGKVEKFVSEYYPGEALLAMARIYALDADENWLDTAEKGAQWLINVRDKDLPIEKLNHDHWLLYALNELYRHRPDPLYLQHTSRIATAIVESQNLRPEFPDWLGSYYKPPRSTPTATRSEGLYAAYQLIRDFDSQHEANRILEAMRRGNAFQLQTQFRPESVMYF